MKLPCICLIVIWVNCPCLLLYCITPHPTALQITLFLGRLNIRLVIELVWQWRCFVSCDDGLLPLSNHDSLQTTSQPQSHHQQKPSALGTILRNYPTQLILMEQFTSGEKREKNPNGGAVTKYQIRASNLWMAFIWYHCPFREKFHRHYLALFIAQFNIVSIHLDRAYQLQ